MQQIAVKKADGTTLLIPIGMAMDQIHEERKPDFVKNYAHMVLETGMTFRYFLHIIKRVT